MRVWFVGRNSTTLKKNRAEYGKADTWLDEALVHCRQFEAECPHPEHSELLFVTLCDYAEFAEEAKQFELAESLRAEAEGVAGKISEFVPEWGELENLTDRIQSLRGEDSGQKNSVSPVEPTGK